MLHVGVDQWTVERYLETFEIDRTWRSLQLRELHGRVPFEIEPCTQPDPRRCPVCDAQRSQVWQPDHVDPGPLAKLRQQADAARRVPRIEYDPKPHESAKRGNGGSERAPNVH